MSSPRERAEAAASRAAEDIVLPNQNPRSGGMGHSVTFNRSMRDAAAKKEFEKQESSPTSSATALADYYLAEHKREQAQAKANEAQHLAEQKHRAKEQERIRAHNLKVKLLEIFYEQTGATPAEIARVETLIRQNHPESFGNVDVHKVLLLELRSLLG